MSEEEAKNETSTLSKTPAYIYNHCPCYIALISWVAVKALTAANSDEIDADAALDVMCEASDLVFDASTKPGSEVPEQYKDDYAQALHLLNHAANKIRERTHGVEVSLTDEEEGKMQ